MLSNTRIKKEIEAVKEAIKKLIETSKKCEDGVLVNNLVLDAFNAALERR